MVLHLPSLFFLSTVLGLLGTALLIRGGSPVPLMDRHPACRPMLLAAVVQALASVGHSLRGELPLLVIFSFVNATQILAGALLWVAARRLASERTPLWWAAVPPLLWLALCLLPGFMETQRLRIGVYGPAVLGIASAATIALMRCHARHGVRGARDLAVVLGLAVLGLGTLYTQAWLGPAHAPTGWGIVGSGASIVAAAYGAGLPFLLLSIRHELERGAQEASRLAAIAAGRAQVERLHHGLPAVIFLHEADPGGGFHQRYQGGDVARVLGDVEVGHPPEAHLRRALLEGAAREEWTLPQPDGSPRHIRTEIRCLGLGPEGRMELGGYSLDVTRERLANARAIASSRLASLGEMGAGLAHEVMQPLQSLSLSAELALLALARGAPEEVRRKLEAILMDTERAASIIEHVRRFARGDGEGEPLLPTVLATPVSTALGLLRAALAEARVKVDLDLGEPPPVVIAAQVSLEQILVNLLLNARDALATLPAGVARHLIIRAAFSGEDDVTLTVADNGGGIAAEMLPRLFEPFATTKAPKEGRGLGLATSHGLARAMGGSLAGANAGGGAVFTLTLPRAPVPAAPPSG